MPFLAHTLDNADSLFALVKSFYRHHLEVAYQTQLVEVAQPAKTQHV